MSPRPIYPRSFVFSHEWEGGKGVFCHAPLLDAIFDHSGQEGLSNSAVEKLYSWAGRSSFTDSVDGGGTGIHELGRPQPDPSEPV